MTIYKDSMNIVNADTGDLIQRCSSDDTIRF